MLNLALALLTAQLGGPGAAPGAPDPFASALGAAEAAFAGRDEPARLAEALGRYAEAARLRPDDPAPLLALARAQAFRAQAAPGEAAAAWREAATAAERALRLVAPAAAEALARGGDLAGSARGIAAPAAGPLYWLALATMGMAQARGMAAVLAVKDEARAMMERAAELDERIDHGGPRRALGTWLATVPSAAGGGAAAARVQLDRARALAPDYQLTRVSDAAVLAVLLQDRARFEALLGEVLASDDAPAPAIAPENRLARRLARELLARRDRLF